MKIKSVIWPNIALMIVGILMWFYADYSYYSFVGQSTCGGYTLNHACGQIGSGWYFFAGLGIALLVLGLAIWAYESHRGRLVISSIGIIIAGIATWLSGDYGWFTASLSAGAWHYVTYAGVILVVIGLGLWVYSDRKLNIL